MNTVVQPTTKQNVMIDALRNWHPSHLELIEALTVLKQRVKYSDNALGAQCVAFVVDQLEECIGDVELNRLDQIDAQAWDDSKPRGDLRESDYESNNYEDTL